jgi:Na+/melibiose symporter-like transporter
VVAGLYTTSLLLTWQAGRVRAAAGPTPARSRRRASAWRELKEGLAYVRDTPFLLAAMCLAFLLNLTAFPLTNGLMPYVVKEIYLADQTVLGYMTASTAFGALMGSLLLSRHGGTTRAARLMLVSCVVWYTMLLVFSRLQSPASGFLLLMFAGFAQSASQVPMATLILRNADSQLRGRVMGIRMLMINSNMPGLLISGPLIAAFGYPATAALYCAVGLSFTLLIAVHWRTHLWRRDAQANTAIAR